jgi:hypothetical protein
MTAVSSTSSEKQTPRSTFRKIFFSQRGLRSGWRLVLYVALIPPVAIAMKGLLALFGKPIPDVLFTPTVFLIVLFPMFVMSKLKSGISKRMDFQRRELLENCF